MWFQHFTFLTYCIVYFTPREGEAASPHVRCSSMPTEGDECDSQIDKWYYNRKEGKCNNFMYGDCPRMENKFDSEEECKKNCITTGHQKTEEVGSPSKGSKGHQRPSKTEGSSEETKGGGPKRWRPDATGHQKTEEVGSPSKGSKGHQRPSQTEGSSEETKGGGAKRWRPDGSEEETATGTAPVKRPGGGRAPGKFEGLSGGYKKRPKRRPPPYRPTSVRRRTPRPLPPKPTLGSGHCGARQRNGKCQDNSDKWYHNGEFYTCSRVTEGMCPTVGRFFESCDECFDKCRMGRSNNCEYQK